MDPSSPESPDAGMHRVEKSWSPYESLGAGQRGRIKAIWRRLGLSDEFATLLRYELDMAFLRMRCAWSAGHRRRVRELSARSGLRVHLGCGANLRPGWLNVDCYPPPPSDDAEILVVDMRRPLPLATGSAVAVHSEHFLEHVPLEIAREVLLPECHRILAPGGAIRIGVPDGEFYVDGYLARREGRVEARFEELLGDQVPMMWINDAARSSAHKYLYDYESLEFVLREAGFDPVRRGVANDSGVADFAGADLVDGNRELFTVYAEAIRP